MRADAVYTVTFRKYSGLGLPQTVLANPRNEQQVQGRAGALGKAGRRSSCDGRRT